MSHWELRHDSFGPLETCVMSPYRHLWMAYAGNSDDRSEVLYANHGKFWYSANYGRISIPWAVMDDYGNLVPVPSPNA